MSSTLTPREHEVIMLVAEGMTNAEIARQLGSRPEQYAAPREHLASSASTPGRGPSHDSVGAN